MAHHNVGLLIDRQIRRWDLQHRTQAPEAPSPCVAISRLPWAGGETVGRKVAEWLDYGFFGREIVDRIADEQQIQRQLVADLDERVRHMLDRYVRDALGRSFTESDYHEHLVRTIATLGRRGMAVIVGRGAPFVLTPDRALRVLVVAPADHRAARLAEAERLPKDAAAARLAEQDELRHAFHEHHFHARQDDPVRYDLCVNTASLGFEGSARLVVDALRHRFPTETRRAV